MKLYEKLKLQPSFANYASDVEAVEIAKTVNPRASEYDRVWKKFNLPANRHFLCLACYYSDEYALIKKHANQCILEMEEFFFGEWRSTFQTPEKTVDAGWWKRRFIWMQLFEAAVLWGSVLGKWDFLQRVGTFPESDSCISDGYVAQERDLYVAWAMFLRGAYADMETLLDKVKTGKGRAPKLVAAMLRASAVQDAAQLEKTLNEWLKYYRKEEFPKEKVTKKVTIEGTFFVHWAERQQLAVNVLPEFADHIVKIP